MRTVVLFAVVIAVGAAIGIGLKQATTGDGSASGPTALQPTAQETADALAGAPAALAALHARANELLPGARRTLRARAGRGQGAPGRRERLGVLVRPVPDRDARASSASR